MEYSLKNMDKKDSLSFEKVFSPGRVAALEKQMRSGSTEQEREKATQVLVRYVRNFNNKESKITRQEYASLIEKLDEERLRPIRVLESAGASPAEILAKRQSLGWSREEAQEIFVLSLKNDAELNQYGIALWKKIAEEKPPSLDVLSVDEISDERNPQLIFNTGHTLELVKLIPDLMTNDKFFIDSTNLDDGKLDPDYEGQVVSKIPLTIIGEHIRQYPELLGEFLRIFTEECAQFESGMKTAGSIIDMAFQRGKGNLAKETYKGFVRQFTFYKQTIHNFHIFWNQVAETRSALDSDTKYQKYVSDLREKIQVLIEHALGIQLPSQDQMTQENVKPVLDFVASLGVKSQPALTKSRIIDKFVA
jgi:hypothetical protein